MLANRKDGEINGLNSKLESEQSLVAQLQKKIKELLVYTIRCYNCVYKHIVCISLAFSLLPPK